MANSSHAHNRHRCNAFARRLLPLERRSRLMPILALLALLALLAGAVIISSVTKQHVQLDDGTVWVTSLNHQKAARFNVKNQEADAGIASAAPQFDIAQHNGNTILTEPGQATSIKASTVGTDAQTNVKANTTALTGGDTLAFINQNTGNVWTGRANQLDALSPTTTAPQMKLGSGGRIAVTHNGDSLRVSAIRWHDSHAAGFRFLHHAGTRLPFRRATTSSR
ncbi:ATPase AAA [Bifidobacterium cebidarum]|uniref:ATPase AAA n=1 Tax=Bifidobacterium cebidarum TaxID=2650773 RepID=A0A6I1GMR3_9BIFI|nr:ATPase AAA [Bifidobacterium cebidarum]